MRLPNSDQAIVEQAKIRDYLLNPTHRFGGSKARFFTQFGFSRNAWEVFAIALRKHAEENEVTALTETGFGPRFEIEGELACPDGRHPRVLTVWQLDQGQTLPRLIRAHPLEKNT